MDDGFRIMEGLRKDVKYWKSKFNSLRKNLSIDYVDLYIYQGSRVYMTGILYLKIF